MKNNLFIIIVTVTIGVLVYFWFFDDTPKKVDCNPHKEYCNTLSQFDGY